MFTGNQEESDGHTQYVDSLTESFAEVCDSCPCFTLDKAVSHSHNLAQPYPSNKVYK